jgi:murein DD-endopeptidase MepM/ murein hydrolase activator NlpD
MSVIALKVDAHLLMTSPFSRLTAAHKHALWRGLISAILALTGSLVVMTAFGLAPQSSLDLQTLQAVTPSDDFALLPLDEAQGDGFRSTETVRRGDTLGDVLARAGVADVDVRRLLGDADARRHLGKLRPGQALEVETDEGGRLQQLKFGAGSERKVDIRADDDGFSTATRDARANTVPRFASGEIRSSLFAATDDAGLPDAVAVQLADVFSGVIDFHRGLRKGDRFWLVYEQIQRDGEPAGAGRVLAAEFRNGDATHTAYWFAASGSSGAYYTFDGKSLHKQFLLSPLEFSRITSGFTSARFHPLLQEWRAHRGIDYGAPMGARVRSTADGVIDTIGLAGGYGNLIVVRHSGGYSTAYAHLSGFAGGLRKGSRIEQGQTLGYVGMTGMATGPHLHYEFRSNEVQVDPKIAKSTETPPLLGDARRTFERQRDLAYRQIGLAKQTILARFE